MQLHFVMNPCGRVGDSLHEDILTSGCVVTKLEVLYVGIEVSWKKKIIILLLNKKQQHHCYVLLLARSSSLLVVWPLWNIGIKEKNIFLLLTVPGFMQV